MGNDSYDARLEINRLASLKYSKSDKGKATRLRYKKSKMGKEAVARYQSGNACKVLMERYRIEGKLKDIMKKYNTSERGKAIRRMYEKTEKCRAIRAKYQKSPKMRFWQYKSSAKRRGLVFELTLEEFMTFWQKPCHYCGCSIETIGIDRVDNNKGYAKDNIVPCCEIHNKMKLAMSKDDFVQACRSVIDYLNRDDGTKNA